MQLTDKQLESFRDLYKKRFGVEIDKEEALEEAISLLNLVSCVYKPVTKEQFKQYSQPP